MENRKASHSVA